MHTSRKRNHRDQTLSPPPELRLALWLILRLILRLALWLALCLAPWPARSWLLARRRRAVVAGREWRAASVLGNGIWGWGSGAGCGGRSAVHGHENHEQQP